MRSIGKTTLCSIPTVRKWWHHEDGEAKHSLIMEENFLEALNDLRPG